MIDPKELMLNNVVLAPKMFLGNCPTDECNEMVFYRVVFISSVFSNKFEPVELTQEILEAAGFGYNGNDKCFGYVNETEGILIELGDYYEYDGRAVFYYNLPDIDNSTCIAYCKHLHQLQNLYFTLTGQELQIDLQKLNK